MDFNKVNLNLIQYSKNIVKYLGKKFIIKIPIMICESGIEENYGKYQIKLGSNLEFIDFIKTLENNNKKHTKKDTIYRSQLRDDNSIILKIPYRYNKFELKIEIERIYLPIIHDLKSGTKIIGTIEIQKIWNYLVDKNVEDQYWTSGCIMEIKEIIII